MDKSFSSFSKEHRFQDLCETVQHCMLCSRLCNRTKVLSKNNGNYNSKVLFIAEAPGRLGADRTGIPLYGDKTGDNFEKLIGNIGWRREDIFITNAVICNPREENGNNDTPSSEEIKNCSFYLRMTIDLVEPDVIVTLGKTALDALNFINPHFRQLKESVGIPFPWDNRIVFPLYHPGPRALVHRSLIKQRSDYFALSKIVDPIKGIRKRQINKYKQLKLEEFIETTTIQKLILLITQKLGKITYFKLTKLLYLIDLNALDKFGYTLTDGIYLRQQEGPWLQSLKKEVEILNGKEIISSFSGKTLFIGPGPAPRFTYDFDEHVLSLVLDILQKYRDYNNASIKTVVYRTPPMRYILKQESLGRDMRKIPVLYKNKKSFELDKENV